MANNERSISAYGAVDTWAGSIRVEAGPHGVRAAEIPHWTETGHPSANVGTITIFDDADEEALGHLRQALTELREYFGGQRRTFTVPLDLQGTAFYRAAWAEVASVPFGETRTYAEIAQSIGAPTAIRAAGAANGANPVAPFVPCHRIVGSDGRLTGYGPGLPLKARLLAMEGAIPADASGYDAWAAGLAAHNNGNMPALGIRGTSRYCLPGCVRSRARWALPSRIFASVDDARAAGYEPCPLCHGAQ
ncbi:MAG TPA: methylated-DNA--[protein]-cysteine S-methyltransferase [Ktedonobacterales bacterium]|nr:methylated-DNA--[protein]-cysteine S-methyltransferase [Ktedonobacterales bacterium]